MIVVHYVCVSYTSVVCCGVQQTTAILGLAFMESAFLALPTPGRLLAEDGRVLLAEPGRELALQEHCGSDLSVFLVLALAGRPRTVSVRLLALLGRAGGFVTLSTVFLGAVAVLFVLD